jgi:uncharacterized protein (DUF2336 family)
MSEVSAITELESAIAAFPPQRRARILQRILDAFLPLAERLKDQHIDVFDQVIVCLIAEIENQPLVELGLKLAPLPRAPRRTVRLLALNTDFTIAGSVLAESEQLTQDELAEAANAGGPRHLLAISGRGRLEPPVTDVLVRRADFEAMRVLAGNPGATFSPSGYVVMAERAAEDAATAEKIIQRFDCTPDHLQVMIARADETVRARLVGAAPAPRRIVVERLIARQSAEPPAAAESTDDAQYYAQTMARLKQAHGTVTEKEVAVLAADKKTGEATAALAILSGIAPEAIEELMDQERLEPFLMMCKAGNFRWSTVRALLELRPRPGKSMQDFLTQACDDFNRLSPGVSQQALKFWQRRRAAAP